jgi:8-oxo-dGTP pyrophosphatase MutT (NUDIX family)
MGGTPRCARLPESGAISSTLHVRDFDHCRRMSRRGVRGRRGDGRCRGRLMRSDGGIGGGLSRTVMIRSPLEQRPLDAAVVDAAAATLEFDRARAWLRAALAGVVEPLGAEVWVLDPALQQVVLVRHPARGLVPPDGKVEPGECPRDGAARELAEETGLRPRLHVIQRSTTSTSTPPVTRDKPWRMRLRTMGSNPCRKVPSERARIARTARARGRASPFRSGPAARVKRGR